MFCLKIIYEVKQNHLKIIIRENINDSILYYENIDNLIKQNNIKGAQIEFSKIPEKYRQEFPILTIKAKLDYLINNNLDDFVTLAKSFGTMNIVDINENKLSYFYMINLGNLLAAYIKVIQSNTIDINKQSVIILNDKLQEKFGSEIISIFSKAVSLWEEGKLYHSNCSFIKSAYNIFYLGIIPQVEFFLEKIKKNIILQENEEVLISQIEKFDNYLNRDSDVQEINNTIDAINRLISGLEMKIRIIKERYNFGLSAEMTFLKEEVKEQFSKLLGIEITNVVLPDELTKNKK